MELLGNERFAWVGPESRYWKIEERWVVALLAFRRDDVAEADVHLEGRVGLRPDRRWSSVPVRRGAGPRSTRMSCIAGGVSGIEDDAVLKDRRRPVADRLDRKLRTRRSWWPSVTGLRGSRSSRWSGRSCRQSTPGLESRACSEVNRSVLRRRPPRVAVEDRAHDGVERRALRVERGSRPPCARGSAVAGRTTPVRWSRSLPPWPSCRRTASRPGRREGLRAADFRRAPDAGRRSPCGRAERRAVGLDRHVPADQPAEGGSSPTTVRAGFVMRAGTSWKVAQLDAVVQRGGGESDHVGTGSSGSRGVARLVRDRDPGRCPATEAGCRVRGCSGRYRRQTMASGRPARTLKHRRCNARPASSALRRAVRDRGLAFDDVPSAGQHVAQFTGRLMPSSAASRERKNVLVAEAP